MRRILLMTIAVLALASVPAAHAEPGVTLLLKGGVEDDFFSVGLSADGRSYEIESRAPLEVVSEICVHPEGEVTRLSCEAPPISGFELVGGAGDDTLLIDRKVAVASTLRGSQGDDVLTGGSGDDRLLGESGDDTIAGAAGSDELGGGAGKDFLYGKAGNDRLIGGAGADRLWGGSGNDVLYGGAGHDALIGGSGVNVVVQ